MGGVEQLGDASHDDVLLLLSSVYETARLMQFAPQWCASRSKCTILVLNRKSVCAVSLLEPYGTMSDARFFIWHGCCYQLFCVTFCAAVLGDIQRRNSIYFSLRRFSMAVVYVIKMIK